MERLGVQRTRDAARQAALALLVLDGSRPLTAEDEDGHRHGCRRPPACWCIVNKTDLPRRGGTGGAGAALRAASIPCPPPREQGVDALCRGRGGPVPRRKARLKESFSPTPGRLTPWPAALEAVRSARRALEGGMTPDAVLTDAEAALEALGELNGKRIREDLVQTIFSRFCVGK